MGQRGESRRRANGQHVISSVTVSLHSSSRSCSRACWPRAFCPIHRLAPVAARTQRCPPVRHRRLKDRRAFCTGGFHRVADAAYGFSSTATTASTALSVAVSSLSSCALTRSTEPRLVDHRKNFTLCPSGSTKKVDRKLRPTGERPSQARYRRHIGRSQGERGEIPEGEGDDHGAQA